MRSGIVLAGGRSTRFGGEEKSLKQVRGKRMICRVIDALQGVVDEIVISVRDEGQRGLIYDFIQGYRFAYDEKHGIGPLAGIVSCLKLIKGDYVFIAACDMPFINKKAVELLFERAEGHDAAVPQHDNGLIEPLHAVYRRGPMLEAVEASLEAGERRISAPLKHLKDVAYVPVADIKKVDPELDTFLNINRAEDMSRVTEK
jgi:molybdopterin-guanine dinucleotide biosynthesis protein A